MRHLKNVLKKVVIVIIVKHFNAKFRDICPCEAFKKCAHEKPFKFLETGFTFKKRQKESPRYVLKNFGKFTEKNLCRSLILNKVASLPISIKHLRWLLLIRL